MSLSPEAIDFALELLSELPNLTTRRMMGGLCIYSAGQVFAILDSDGTVFLKAKADFARSLEEAGARQFGAGGNRTMGYWTLPEEALDDPERAMHWARQALQNL